MMEFYTLSSIVLPLSLNDKQQEHIMKLVPAPHVMQCSVQEICMLHKFFSDAFTLRIVTMQNI